MEIGENLQKLWGRTCKYDSKLLKIFFSIGVTRLVWQCVRLFVGNISWIYDKKNKLARMDK